MYNRKTINLSVPAFILFIGCTTVIESKFTPQQINPTSAQPTNPRQTSTAAPLKEDTNLKQQEDKKPKDDRPRLHIANPFYLPYEGDWQLSITALRLTNRVRTDMPAQTFFGLPQAAAYSESERPSYGLSISLLYGILDRFTIGLGTDFYFSEEPKTTKTGNSSTFATAPALKGPTGPEILLATRFAGTRPGQFYADLVVTLRPGVLSSDENSISVGRSNVTGTLSLGYNFGLTTFGISGTAYYAPAVGGTYSAPSSATATGQVVAQIEWKYVYLRGTFGVLKYVDSTNASEAALKSMIPTYGVFGGIKFSDNTLLDLGFTFTSAVQGDSYNTGYGNSIRQYNTIGPITRLTLGFSVRL